MYPWWHALQLGFGSAGSAESAESDLESVHVKLDNITATLGATPPACPLRASKPRPPLPAAALTHATPPFLLTGGVRRARGDRKQDGRHA